MRKDIWFWQAWFYRRRGWMIGRDGISTFAYRPEWYPSRKLGIGV